MKKIYNLAGALLLSSGLMAQTFVSTSAENKNVVLEEFTGIYCGYCPDGHKRAQDYHDLHPNDVVLINIHEGGYAAPSGGDPDFRTQWGAAIDGQAGVAGYPAGTVNRRLFSGMQQGSGTAMSRGDWATAGGMILAESSCVNVEAQSSINLMTRELTVVVEAYYTAASSVSTNKLNVALLQNNVEGPQSGSSANPTQVLPNGNYMHNHMLRHLLTGQWGDAISTTTSGSFFTQTYVYTIPSDLNGIAYDLFNLEVAVFVSEGNQEILSGNMSPVSFITPPGVSMTDLEATTNMTMPSSYCSTSVTPEITVTNNSSVAIDTFEVSYVLNSNSPVIQSITTSLAAGASSTISFPSISLSSGANNIYYEANLNGNNTLIDSIANNNLASTGEFYTISPTAFATSFSEDFESYSSGDDDLNNAILENPNAENTYVVSNAVGGSAVNWNIGAFGNSPQSYRFRFYSWTGGSYASVVYENLDLSGATNHNLVFAHAYAQYSNENDKLEVNVSTDCGATWTNVYSMAGSSLATTNPYNSGYYYPQTDEWAADNVDLSSFDGEASVMIAFKAIGDSPYTGNNLYIDDIQVGSNVISVEENDIDKLVRVYPNPVKDVATIEFSVTEATEISYQIFNVVGEKVNEITSANINVGTSSYNVSTDNLANGSYFIKYTIGNKVSSKKFLIAK